jgi:hypothetical protein
MRTRTPIQRDQDTTITDKDLERILSTCRNEIRASKDGIGTS